MLQDMLTDADTTESLFDKVVRYVAAAILALPTRASSAVQPETVREAWQERLLALHEHDELAGVVEVIRSARYEAIGLLLDLLPHHEHGGDVEDFTLRRRWFRAVRSRIKAHGAGRLGAQSCTIDGQRRVQHAAENARDQAAAILQESLHWEFADTPLPLSLASALVELEQAHVGLFDAFALFFAARIKEDIRFRQAVLAAEDPEQTIFGVDAPSYLQTLFGIATTIAQRFDTRLKLVSETPAVAPIERVPAEPDLPTYWKGVAVAAAHARGLSRSTLAAIGEHACSKGLKPANAADIIADMAGLLERVRSELAEHQDSNDASRVSRALDEEGPVRALELLGNLIPPSASHPHGPKQVAMARLASIERLKGQLFQLMFEYRGALGYHVRAVELVAAAGEEARAEHVCALIEALIRLGRDGGETEPLEQAAGMCAALLNSPWLKFGSRLWIEVKHHQANALMAQARQQDNVAKARKAEEIYGEVLAGLSVDEDSCIASTAQLRRGQALLWVATHSGNKAIRERAVAALRSATASASINRDSQQYAWAHGALGDALVATAQGEERKARLREAVQAYDTARLACSNEVSPFEWINLHLKLGSTSGLLAREESDNKTLERSLSVLEMALQGIPSGFFKELRAEILLETGHLHSALATGGSWQSAQQRAILAYARGLAEPELRSNQPILWAQHTQRWAAGLLRLAKHTKDPALASEAIHGLQEALALCATSNHSLHGANIQHHLGSAFLTRAELLSSDDDLADAEVAYRHAIDLRLPEKMPLLWAQSVIGLASVLSALVESDPSRAPALSEVVQKLEHALQLDALQNKPHLIDTVASRLNTARLMLAKSESKTTVAGIAVPR